MTPVFYFWSIEEFHPTCRPVQAVEPSERKQPGQPCAEATDERSGDERSKPRPRSSGPDSPETDASAE